MCMSSPQTQMLAAGVSTCCDGRIPSRRSNQKWRSCFNTHLLTDEIDDIAYARHFLQFGEPEFHVELHLECHDEVDVGEGIPPLDVFGRCLPGYLQILIFK